MKNFDDKITLVNGVEMPQLGLGVYKMTNPEETFEAITYALQNGYRAIDTAAIYNNERETGEAVRQSGIPREELFITSKVWNDDQGYDETLRAFEASLERLGMDYLDLYLTHWPVANKYVDTYRAIERLYDEKLIRSTGVSNHHIHHLEKIFNVANVKPMVNQIELHPNLSQETLRNFCREHEIAVTSWSPLARGALLDSPLLTEIGLKYGKSPAQVIIKWHLQHGLIVIPKSVTPERIKSNIEVKDFELAPEDMMKIDSLNKDERRGTNPDKFGSKSNVGVM
ncbi:aldo/keto reductase [Sporosarcina thermotolerans]|uniref:Aldo/keto reductase n=1 Tax=Sporosarcina thermotolerans TaxID=633404 RepID=A0AAW9AGS1_9BACL|nr:aldo/keto reductase [Sporosarcina thermotolerans]MDW0118881.1 aldo/keto reductase [Sporosarcina thermotolerans]WHT49385.1 aldo/keto reductase [Sporosarcina thermotolerans]